MRMFLSSLIPDFFVLRAPKFLLLSYVRQAGVILLLPDGIPATALYDVKFDVIIQIALGLGNEEGVLIAFSFFFVR